MSNIWTTILGDNTTFTLGAVVSLERSNERDEGVKRKSANMM